MDKYYNSIVVAITLALASPSVGWAQQMPTQADYLQNMIGQLAGQNAQLSANLSQAQAQITTLQKQLEDERKGKDAKQVSSPSTNDGRGSAQP